MATRHIKIFEPIVNWFLNLPVCNVIDREIKREKLQMKPPSELKGIGGRNPSVQR